MEIKPKILAVDDSSTVIAHLKSLLEDSYTIKPAYNGEEGLKLVKSFKPDLILLDVMMPGISGIEVLRRLSKNKQLPFTPVIMITAETDENIVKEVLEAGAYDYIKKPFSEVELKARINSALQLSYFIKLLKETNEDLLIAKEAAESANRVKNTFLANMSHELRTPLNAVLGFSQILSMQKIGALNSKQLEFVENIRTSGEHLLEMVNDILDLSKIEGEKMAIESGYFDFKEMLQGVLSTISLMAQKKNITISINISPDAGEIYGDPVRIRQVIYSLLSNAVKFTQEGKMIGVETDAVNSKVIITVWDEGCGITDEVIERIFDPFEQVISPKDGKPKGAGLGLALSNRIVELHNGSIDVQSKVGEGSRFTVTLPQKAAITN